jgi:hypothetical protein
MGVSKTQFRYVEKSKSFRRKLGLSRRKMRRLRRHPRRAKKVVVRAKKKKCFAADATVQLADGNTARMDQLRHGDSVLTVTESGATQFREVFFFAHQDAKASSTMTCLAVSGQELCLSGDHFVRAGHSSEWLSSSYMRAQDVVQGMTMWLAKGSEMQAATVEGVALKWKQGLYSPLTTENAMVVVNGVVASIHSEWFLDSITPDSLSWALPSIYETALSGFRFFYHYAGSEWAQSVQQRLNLLEVAHDNDGLAGVVLPYAELLRSELPTALRKLAGVFANQASQYLL